MASKVMLLPFDLAKIKPLAITWNSSGLPCLPRPPTAPASCSLVNAQQHSWHHGFEMFLLQSCHSSVLISRPLPNVHFSAHKFTTVWSCAFSLHFISWNFIQLLFWCSDFPHFVPIEVSSNSHYIPLSFPLGSRNTPLNSPQAMFEMAISP